MYKIYNKLGKVVAESDDYSFIIGFKEALKLSGINLSEFVYFKVYDNLDRIILMDSGPTDATFINGELF